MRLLWETNNAPWLMVIHCDNYISTSIHLTTLFASSPATPVSPLCTRAPYFLALFYDICDTRTVSGDGGGPFQCRTSFKFLKQTVLCISVALNDEINVPAFRVFFF